MSSSAELHSLNGKLLGSYSKTLSDKTVYETSLCEGVPPNKGIINYSLINATVPLKEKLDPTQFIFQHL